MNDIQANEFIEQNDNLRKLTGVHDVVYRISAKHTALSVVYKFTTTFTALYALWFG
jgi:hypothetical protein